MKKAISFEAIPGAGGGRICLTIQPPGTWFDNTDYVIFVGGCGVGREKTLAAAKKMLFLEAQRYLQRQIRDAQATANHYQSELDKRNVFGYNLVPSKE